MAKFQFDGNTQRIYIDPTAVSGSVITFTPQELWTEWIDWVSVGDNSKYLPAFESVMIPLDATTMLGQYLFIRNDLGWRGVPPAADQVTIVINGSFYAKDPALPVMVNHPNQETDLVINRSTLTNTAMINSAGTDLTTVMNKLTELQNSMATKSDVYAASLL